jgi:hypothetical protein
VRASFANGDGRLIPGQFTPAPARRAGDRGERLEHHRLVGVEARMDRIDRDQGGEHRRPRADQQIVTARDLDVRANAAKEAKASLDAAKAALAAARLNLQALDLRRVGRRVDGHQEVAGLDEFPFGEVRRLDRAPALRPADRHRPRPRRARQRRQGGEGKPGRREGSLTVRATRASAPATWASRRWTSAA